MVHTLFIGLDGATFTLLDPLTRDRPGEGVVMPFLAQVLARGYAAPLRSTPHPLTPPAWVSLMTGRSPGQHGVYDFVRFEDRGDEVYFTLYDSRDIRVPTVWSLLDGRGRRVCALNFPMMAPPPALDHGSLLPGFVSWKHLRRNCVPADLYDRIKAMPGFDARELAWDFEREGQIGEPMSQDELEDWVRHHLPREEQWFGIAETLLREDAPDLFAVMFDGTDKIQHQCWHVLDPALFDPATASAEDGRLRALVLEYFRRLDGYIERLATLAGPAAHLILASDHGFTASADVLRINRFLGEAGYLAWATDDGSEAAQRRAAANFAYLDWTKTLAYCPTPSSNGVVIRQARQPGAPGIDPADYSAFRARLCADLMGVINPQTGAPAIDRILTREEAFPGAAMGEAPDLTLILADCGFVSVRNRAPVMVRRPVPLGTHHPDGIFIAAGPGIAAGRRGERLSILDVPVVFLYSQGEAIPVDFEGRLPADLFTPAHLAREAPRLGPPAATALATATTATTAASAHVGGVAGSGGAAEDDDMDEGEKQHILDQLRALGYLED